MDTFVLERWDMWSGFQVVFWIMAGVLVLALIVGLVASVTRGDWSELGFAMTTGLAVTLPVFVIGLLFVGLNAKAETNKIREAHLLSHGYEYAEVNGDEFIGSKDGDYIAGKFVEIPLADDTYSLLIYGGK